MGTLALVRLEHAEAEELADRLEESWLLTAPGKLVDTYAGSS